jgi:pilus assembly protein CpaB
MPDAVEKLQGSIVRGAFVVGEPIREGEVGPPRQRLYVGHPADGMRAIAVRISAQNTAGGFILPNDRVDVVQTVSQQASPEAQAESVSRTILTNVKVLAIDQTVDEAGGEAVVVGKTATLELDPVQVELVTAAEASGTLSLSLRSMADTDELVTVREKRQSGTVRIFRSGRSQTVTTQ